MPTMTLAQELGWHALMDLSEEIPEGWSLVGGQMVHLWCADRGVNLARPTDDVDAVLDVRAQPDIHFNVTAALQRRGFQPETSTTGVQHRWTRGDAVVDVLIPRHLGQRAANRPGAGGGRTIETPGAQKVINRTEVALVRVGDRGRGSIRARPSWAPSSESGAAAFACGTGPEPQPSFRRLVLLASVLTPRDVRNQPRLDKRELALVGNAVGNARRLPSTWSYVPTGADALDRLSGIVAAARPARQACRGVSGDLGEPSGDDIAASATRPR